MEDKIVERNRYDARAKSLLRVNPKTFLEEDFLSSTAAELQSPYIFFQQQLRVYLKSSHVVLEIGSGTGAITNWLVLSGAKVIASDISSYSVDFLNQRYGEKSNFNAVQADMEALPFPDHSFDIVVSAGSLSYGDNEVTMMELFRILRPGGKFICVDSLGHNPIYRINRYVHYLLGSRTKSTLNRMPKLKLIKYYEEMFGRAEPSFFGSITWMFPFLRLIVGAHYTAQIGRWFDNFIQVRRSAFKFVMIVSKNL